ncbi:hypothetical protein M8J75_016301 [Diaphorina citri]|nr:hypothetical protein M8J75_016301 [Diaphorina citri]KAI5720345.1 hypothetical protein M8J77_005266 [Diaphorina citri]
MTPTSNIHVVVTLADGSNEYDHSKVYLDDMDEETIDYNNNNMKGVRMFRELINKLKIYQKHQKHERQSSERHNREDYTWNTSPANERYSSSSSSSSNSSTCSNTYENSKSSSNSSSQHRLDNITGYFKFINTSSSPSTPTTCKQQTNQKKLLRSPTSYMYIKGMSGLHSRVPKY